MSLFPTPTRTPHPAALHRPQQNERSLTRRGDASLVGLLLLSLALAGCFPRGPGPRLAHFDSQAPQVGSLAPNFQAVDLDGQILALTDVVGDKPIVLQLGSHSCPVYRYRRFWMEDLHRDFEDRVHFIVLYTREAHPVGSPSPYATKEWDPWINRVTSVRVKEPATLEDRRELAKDSKRRLEMASTYWVDSMQDEAWELYGSSSAPAFVLDRSGLVTLRQVWIEPKEIRAELERLLKEDSPVSIPDEDPIYSK